MLSGPFSSNGTPGMGLVDSALGTPRSGEDPWQSGKGLFVFLIHFSSSLSLPSLFHFLFSQSGFEIHCCSFFLFIVPSIKNISSASLLHLPRLIRTSSNNLSPPSPPHLSPSLSLSFFLFLSIHLLSAGTTYNKMGNRCSNDTWDKPSTLTFQLDLRKKKPETRTALILLNGKPQLRVTHIPPSVQLSVYHFF